ncbi:MAG: ImmA/IrrE family metallo-endopeptidase [Sphaerochaetaceae bacterium]
MREKIELNAEALSLRNQLGVDSRSPIDVFALLHNNPDLTLVFYPMSSGVSGICILDGINKIIGINSATTYGRQRFTIAHELYHLFYNEGFTSIVCSVDLEATKNVQEKEADMFASFFLAPYESLVDFIRNKLKKDQLQLEVEDVVAIEQYFGLSRQATLCRLTNDKFLAYEKSESMKTGIIASAKKLGHSTNLYRPSLESDQYATYGKYIKAVESLKEKELISYGKYDELLLDGFRSDMVYESPQQNAGLYD